MVTDAIVTVFETNGKQKCEFLPFYSSLFVIFSHFTTDTALLYGAAWYLRKNKLLNDKIDFIVHNCMLFLKDF